MSQLWKKQASVAYGYSLTRLALNEYMYLEDMPAEGMLAEGMPEKISLYGEQFHQLLELHLQQSDCLEQIKVLRSRLQREMETVVAMTDCFRIYEYALNRVERRFRNEQPAVEADDAVFTEQLLAFVTGSDDTAVMNHRVQLVIGQLPVRFTKNKFYSMVREALSVYIGSDRSGLDNIMYLLRTGAMVALDNEKMEEYPRLAELLKHLRQLDFKTMTAADFENAGQMITMAGEQLYEYSENYQLLQEMINDLYVLQLTAADAVRDQHEESTAVSLLQQLLQLYHDTAGVDSEGEIMAYLHQLEGSQEHYYEKYQRLENAPEYKAGEEEWADKSRRVERLLSTSSFAELEAVTEEVPVDAALLDETATAFFEQLSGLFSACQKPVTRAVMASVLAILPVCFNSLDEIRNYIGGSLASCSDLAEKETSKELLQLIMESDGYAML